MKIKHNSWWLQWAYLGSEPYERPNKGATINLCPLFWRIVLLSPFKVSVLILASPVIIVVLVGTGVKYVWDTYLASRIVWRTDRAAATVDDYVINPIYEGVKAVTKKVCPLVRVE